jgi:HAD superfamily hydrolase (TIGR01509 family)
MLRHHVTDGAHTARNAPDQKIPMSLHPETITDFDAIIFDMDGLLLDTERLSFDSFVTTAAAYDQHVVFDDYRRLIGRNAKTGIEILRSMLPTHIDAMRFKNEWLDVYRGLLDDTIELKPGASHFLAHLAEAQIPRAVATSSSGKKARAILDKVGLWQYIPHLTGGDEVKAGKPAPDVYLDAATKLGIAPSRCIAFEDSETGTAAALTAGMRVVQIPDLIAAERPPAPPQFYVASSLCEGAALLGIDLLIDR